MKTVNSISGGKTSSYVAKHYPADIDVFSLVRIEDRECLWMQGKDEPTRNLISDRLGCEFVGTPEMDLIIYTILDLEQFLGREITMITGKSFEQIIKDRGDYLPNRMVRYCTVEMKLVPIFEYLKENTKLPVKMRIGYRPTEKRRANNMIERANEYGIEEFNKVPYRVAEFPLIDNNVQKHTIYDYWEDKPVRFAYRNNCVMCINRQPLMISHMATKEKRKIEWAKRIEDKTGNQFLREASMSKILNYSTQGNLFNDEDFSYCDSGFCGI